MLLATVLADIDQDGVMLLASILEGFVCDPEAATMLLDDDYTHRQSRKALGVLDLPVAGRQEDGSIE